jgi:hypothetical protein
MAAQHYVQRRNIRGAIEFFFQIIGTSGFFFTIWPLKKGGADKLTPISKRVKYSQDLSAYLAATK